MDVQIGEKRSFIIQNCTQRQVQALNLRFRQNKTYREIGLVLGIGSHGSLDLVKRGIKRAKKKFKKQMKI